MTDVTPGMVVLEYLRGLQRTQGLDEARRVLQESQPQEGAAEAENVSEEEMEALRALAEEDANKA